MRTTTTATAWCCAAAFAALTGCGVRDFGPGDAEISAVATTTQVADLVRHVGGDRVAVRQILQPNSDPHDYEPRPSDARKIAGANVIFRSGGDVDAWTSDLIASNGGKASTDTLIDSVRRRPGDPHWWQDPREAVRAVASIRGALVRADPAGRAGYDRNAAAYTRRLRRLDVAIAACVGQLPRARRKLVTSHDALGYYAARYRLKLVGTVIPSLSSQAQPSSKDVNRLVERIRREGVKAIFPESSLNPKLEAAVARESGARVGGALWADALGPTGSSGAGYIASIEANTHEIVKGLSGGAVNCPPGRVSARAPRAVRRAQPDGAR